MHLRIRDLELPLRHPFTVAHGTKTVQRNLLVELTQDGVSGFGECASSLAYPRDTPASMRASLEAARPAIEAEQLVVAAADAPAQLWDRLEPVLGHDRFAFCGLDQAAHDLWGKLRGAPVWKLWGHKLENVPASNYTIGIADIETMVAKMQEFAGWPIYKIKLGTDRDLAIVRELRKHTDATFRIDANTGWTAAQTVALAPELRDLGVEFIEQPLKPGNWDGMKVVYENAVLPVIADESCLVESDIARCARVFHGVNIKLAKAGGLTPARRMIAAARQHGLRVMVGCMTESAVAISAIAQLLPELDYVDMDGAELIAPGASPAAGVRLDKGTPIFPDHVHGNGVTLTERAV